MLWALQKRYGSVYLCGTLRNVTEHCRTLRKHYGSIAEALWDVQRYRTLLSVVKNMSFCQFEAVGAQMPKNPQNSSFLLGHVNPI